MASKIMIVLPVEEMEGEIEDLLRQYSESGKTGVFVCLNKPFNYRIERLKRQGIDLKSIFLIDAISGRELPTDEKVKFVTETSNRRIIEGIVALITEEPRKEYIILESLRTLEIYEGEKALEDFLRKINQVLMERKVSFVALASNHFDYGKVVSFFDKVIDVK